MSIESLYGTSPNWSGPITSEHLENSSPKQSSPKEGSNSLLLIQAMETPQTNEKTTTPQQQGTIYNTLDNDAEESVNCKNQKIHKRKRNRTLKDILDQTPEIVPVMEDADCERFFVSKLFQNKKVLKRKLDLMALKKKLQYRVYKSDKSGFLAVCLDDNCKWTL